MVVVFAGVMSSIASDAGYVVLVPLGAVIFMSCGRHPFACLLYTSMASLNIAGHGCGIRYKYGFFNQKIIDGSQVETPDSRLKNGNVWDVKKPDKSEVVKFGAVSYTHLKTFKNMLTNYLRFDNIYMSSGDDTL